MLQHIRLQSWIALLCGRGQRHELRLYLKVYDQLYLRAWNRLRKRSRHQTAQGKLVVTVENVDMLRKIT